MKLTEVRVHPVNNDKLKGYATIVLNDAFVVRDLKIIEGAKGLFVAMPNKQRKDGTYRDIAHPVNKEVRSIVEEAVLQAYYAVQDTENTSSEETFSS